MLDGEPLSERGPGIPVSHLHNTAVITLADDFAGCVFSPPTFGIAKSQNSGSDRVLLQLPSLQQVS
jgi:hypothetical protein